MSEMIYDTSVLTEGCKELGIELSEQQIQAFMTYFEYLTEKNQVMNLTNITEFTDVMKKHFVDSVSLVKAVDVNGPKRLLDVGTGAGFPGLPLKIVFPELQVTLLDSLNKRIRFLNELIEKLNLTGIEAIHGRAEDIARDKKHREQYDLVVSRAVANLSSLSEYCIPFVKKNGYFVSYKSMDVDTEIKDAKKALFVLGGQMEKKESFLLPDSDIGRTLLAIKKVKTTPGTYPRKAGLPSKNPL